MKLASRIILSLMFFQTSCKEAPPGMDREIDKSSIIGCYQDKSNRNSLSIEKDTISFNGKIVYEKYSYGLDGSAREPLIYAYPRMYASERKDGELYFWAYDKGEGGVTLFLHNYKGRIFLEVPIFSQESLRAGIISHFWKKDC